MIKQSLIIGAMGLATLSFGQKSIETSAAVERNKANGLMMRGNIAEAKKAFVSAKEFIDKAAAHEDTKNRQKTLWLKGDIYTTLFGLALQTGDTTLVKSLGEDVMDEAIDALKKGYPLGKKHQSDITETVDKNRNSANQIAGMAYKAEQFEAAAELYDLQARFGECIEFVDSTAIFNSALCFDKSEKYEKAAPMYARLVEMGYQTANSASMASAAYRKLKKYDEAKAIVTKAREKYPTDRGLLMESVNTFLEQGDAEGAESALNEAIATDPNNKQLHYVIGTIYNDLKKNAEAEKALNKALEIDPDYADAQYQLGAVLVSWAGDLRAEANRTAQGDSNYDKLMAQSKEVYGRAVAPLEKYIQKDPKNKTVLTILSQIHRNIGNSEKALEYKRKADAL